MPNEQITAALGDPDDITFEEARRLWGRVLYSAFFRGVKLDLEPQCAALLKEFWAHDFVANQGIAADDSCQKVAVCKLRKELRAKSVPYIIRNIRSKGYILQPLPSMIG